MEIVNYSQLSIEELKEMLEKERARRLLLEVQNNVLREYIGLEKLEEKESKPKGVIIPFTRK